MWGVLTNLHVYFGSVTECLESECGENMNFFNCNYQKDAIEILEYNVHFILSAVRRMLLDSDCS